MGTDTKTIRVTLDIELRPLTADELMDAEVEQLDEDCRPSGDGDDLAEIDPYDFADMIRYAVQEDDDLWAGSALYAAVSEVTVASADQVPA